MSFSGGNAAVDFFCLERSVYMKFRRLSGEIVDVARRGVSFSLLVPWFNNLTVFFVQAPPPQQQQQQQGYAPTPPGMPAQVGYQYNPSGQYSSM